MDLREAPLSTEAARGSLAPEPSPQEENVLRTASEHASILMVDDHPANLLALEAVLLPLGHNLVRATSGEEALKYLLSNDVAVILLDVQMPGMDGFETARLIKQRARTKHIPILFITAIHREGAHVFKGYSQGAVDYLLKPVDPDILRSKVSVFVDLYVKTAKVREQERLLREKERDNFEQKLERRFRTLTDLMPLCLWATRPDGKVYYCNRSWTEYSGLDGEEAMDLMGPTFVHADDVSRVRESWGAALASRKELEIEFRLRKADGTYRWHFGRAVPEEDEQGAVQGWVLSAMDIDDRKRVEETRLSLLNAEREAREQAEVANRAKDEFLATVSHELRTPLNAILGWARMLRSGMLDPKKLERALDTIVRNAQVQKELIEDILDVSRIVTGKLRIQLRRISCIQIVQAALDTVKPTADARGVQLASKIDPTADQATGDPDRLQQVVWNLLSNAIKFTPKGGTVTLTLERQDSQVELRVADTGRGISPAFLPHVFDRFRQEDGISTRTQGGLGLGLAIVRHLVELHGGSVSATSEGEGQGATFTVRLPLRVIQVEEREESWMATQANEVEETANAEAGVSLEGIRVLFVDDTPDARELFTELLSLHGALVTAVESAALAIEELGRSEFDVLVSDIGLPAEDGYSLMRRIRELPATQNGRIPAIAVTGFARAEDGKRALDAGFQNHLAKPVEPIELMSLVASLSGNIA
ncbi:MAG: hybrid sensor histidine kinase/response regulator [Myxococcaceae bacterium]